MKYLCLAGLAVALGSVGAVDAAAAPAPVPAARPNFLIILADDCTYNDLSLYGGQNAKTPNIDRLAEQGMVFERAYLSMSMCQPSRAELYSGQFPLRNGCAWNHSRSRAGTRSLPHHLSALGYRVGIAGKVDVLPKKAFPFEDVGGFDANCVRNPTRPHELQGIREFMSGKAGQPFCLVVALVEPHVPWVMGDPSQYPPAQIRLPANIADTPRTRENYSRYLAEITYMDGQVGDILATLKETGAESETCVLFTSEQGSQFPGNKWTCWDTGLHTGLIARWAGHVPGGKRTRAIVEYADIVPTLVELAGGNPARAEFQFDGTSFLPVLRGEKNQHRAYAYGVHNNLPEGAAYPSRTVTDGQWRYIRNLTPRELFTQKYMMGIQGGGELNNLYWATWMSHVSDNAKTYGLVRRFMSRPAEELYNTAQDPFEMTNLADQPQQEHIKQQLSAELDRWMKTQGDPGKAMDTIEAFEAANSGQHKYFAP